MSLAEFKEEMDDLDEIAERLGHDEKSTWYKKMTKKLEKKYLGDGGGGGGKQAASSGDTHRRSMVWNKVKELKCGSFDDAIAKLGTVFGKCKNWRGDTPRGGTLRVKGETLAYKRKLSEDDGVTTHVRVVKLASGAFSCRFSQVNPSVIWVTLKLPPRQKHEVMLR